MVGLPYRLKVAAVDSLIDSLQIVPDASLALAALRDEGGWPDGSYDADTDMALTASAASQYLVQYVRRYRREYERFTASPPNGAGYPPLVVSPYLNSPALECHLANDGAVIADYSWSPDYQWEVAGGPALLVDLPDTRTPEVIVELLKKHGLYGTNVGISRIVAKHGIPDAVWEGRLPTPVETEVVAEGGTTISVFRYEIDWLDLVTRISFGAFGLILDLKLPSAPADFWTPHIIRDLGIATADRNHKRFFHYLELIRHLDAAAWDTRSIWCRVHVDMRRDFASTVGAVGRPGATIAFNAPAAEVRDYAIGPQATSAQEAQQRLEDWSRLVSDFESLLTQRGQDDEAVFHEFLRLNPVLLDIYGAAIRSKPRFTYPAGESPLGKLYVEPDFVIRYPDRSYKLVELERPDKKVVTAKGEPRKELTQAAFQIGEFRTFIDKHYDQIRQDFPGISSRCSSMVVISRNTEESFGSGRDKSEYMDLIRGIYTDIEFVVYDDLLAMAKQALTNISNLAIEAKH